MNVDKYPYYRNSNYEQSYYWKKNLWIWFWGEEVWNKMCFLVALCHILQICCKCMSCLYTNWNNRVMVLWVWYLGNTVQWLKEESVSYIHVCPGMRLINFFGIWMTMIEVLCLVKFTNFILYNCVVLVNTLRIWHD